MARWGGWRQRFQGWDGRQLLGFDERTRPVTLPDSVPDGTLASSVALAGATLLVMVLVRRPRGVVLVLASLALGCLAMAGAGAALGLRLLLADNGALRSFGALAARGEAGCLLAALMVLPLWATRPGQV